MGDRQPVPGVRQAATSHREACAGKVTAGNMALGQSMPATAWLQDRLQHSAAPVAGFMAQGSGSGQDRSGQSGARTQRTEKPVVIEID